ncbi:MAG TPA: CheR family methyltransferase [Jatrophihabitans sp.]|nr:CheR family methyltransferase [Jatrophihabitans sp.]
MTPRDSHFEQAVDHVAELLHGAIGLRPEHNLRGRLRRGLRDEAAAHGQDPAQFGRGLAVGTAEYQGLLNRITVQETSFFRHAEQFDVLVRDVLPQLPQPVNIWSAGCANGQEAYSLAIVLEEQRIPGAVLATDLSTSALRRTTAARYTPREVDGLSADRLARHLRFDGRTWQVNAAVRDRVRTMQLNLATDLPDGLAQYHVVFCRNVLIYFSQERSRRFLDGLAEALPPEAYLFIGAAEAIWPVTDRFESVRIRDTFVHRPRQPRSAPEPLRRAPAPPPRPAVTHRPRPVPRRPVASAQPVIEDPAELMRSGRAALESGEPEAAIVAFRKWAYLEPQDPLAHLHLGLAFEASANRESAQRAFAVARRLLGHADHAAVEAAIEGYTIADLSALLDHKEWGART